MMSTQLPDVFSRAKIAQDSLDKQQTTSVKSALCCDGHLSTELLNYMQLTCPIKVKEKNLAEQGSL